MPTVVSGPSLPIEGLQLYYDFSNPNCYPGSGDTVYNLVPTQKGITGSLFNSPTYTSNSSTGNFSFNGVNQYLRCSPVTIGPAFTALVIAKSNAVSFWSTNYSNLFGGGTANPGSVFKSTGFTLGTDQFAGTTTNGIRYVACSNGGVPTTSYTVPSSVTNSRLYFIKTLGGASPMTNIYGYNNTFSSSSFAFARTQSNIINLYMATNDNASGAFLNVTIYTALLYNRALNNKEILDIYNIFNKRIPLS